MPPLNWPTRLIAFPKMVPAMLLALAALALPGCFHNDDDPAPPAPPPVVDADPTGYYINGGTINISDLQAIVNGNRIMMMSVVNELLYDGTITNISGNDFTATFTIYDDGENPVTATASGLITTGSSITGTLAGSGVGSGTFSLLYATTNNEVASLSRIENTTNATWGAVIGGPAATAAFEFEIDAAGVVVDDVNNVQGLFDICEIFSGSISPIIGSNLYEVNGQVLCPVPNIPGGNYTGLATTRNEPNVDGTLVFMMTSGAHSFSSDFQ